VNGVSLLSIADRSTLVTLV